MFYYRKREFYMMRSPESTDSAEKENYKRVTLYVAGLYPINYNESFTGFLRKIGAETVGLIRKKSENQYEFLVELPAGATQLHMTPYVTGGYDGQFTHWNISFVRPDGAVTAMLLPLELALEPKTLSTEPSAINIISFGAIPADKSPTK